MNQLVGSFCLGEELLTEGSQQLLVHGFLKVATAGFCVQVDVTTFTI